AVLRNQSCFAERIRECSDERRQAPRRRPVDRRRCGVAKCLVRTIVVERRAETIEAPLLRNDRRRRRARGFTMQRQVHPLVASVLLRLARLDTLVTNGELEPPCRQSRQSSCSRRRERRSIVAAKRVGQTELAKHPREDA